MASGCVPRVDGVGTRRRGCAAGVVSSRRGKRVGTNSGAVATHDTALETRDGIVSRASRCSRNTTEVVRAASSGAADEGDVGRVAQVDLVSGAVDAGACVTRDVLDRARGY